MVVYEVEATLHGLYLGTFLELFQLYLSHAWHVDNFMVEIFVRVVTIHIKIVFMGIIPVVHHLIFILQKKA